MKKNLVRILSVLSAICGIISLPSDILESTNIIKKVIVPIWGVNAAISWSFILVGIILFLFSFAPRYKESFFQVFKEMRKNILGWPLLLIVCVLAFALFLSLYPSKRSLLELEIAYIGTTYSVNKNASVIDVLKENGKSETIFLVRVINKGKFPTAIPKWECLVSFPNGRGLVAPAQYNHSDDILKFFQMTDKNLATLHPSFLKNNLAEATLESSLDKGDSKLGYLICSFGNVLPSGYLNMPGAGFSLRAKDDFGRIVVTDPVYPNESKINMQNKPH